MKVYKLLKILVFFVIPFTIKAQFVINTVINHIDPASGTPTGNINFTITGGTAPYTYSWSPGTATTQALTGVSYGSYTVLVTDLVSNTINPQYNLGYKTYWNDLDGVDVRNDSLLIYPWDHYTRSVLSKNTLTSSADGWSEIVSQGTDNFYLFGFLDSASLVSGYYVDIDYGFYVYYNTLYAIQPNGSYSYIGAQAVGDALRIERIGSNFNLVQNNVTVFTCSMSSATNLKLKTSLYFNSLANIGSSFYDSTSISFKGYVRDIPFVKHCTPGTNNGSVSLTPKIVGASHTYSWSTGSYTTASISSLAVGAYTVDVTDSDLNFTKQKYSVGYKTNWTDLDGAIFRSDSLLPIPYGLGNAISKNTLLSNVDGWSEFISTTDNNYYLFGFIDTIGLAPALNGNYDIDHGIYILGHDVYAVEPDRYYSYIGRQNIGDILRIERSGTDFYIKQNNEIIYTSIATQTVNYKLKTSIYYYPICNIGASFYDSTAISFPGFVQNIPFITHCTPGSNDGTISLTPKIISASNTYSWSSPISSTNSAVTSLTAGIYNVKTKDADLNSSDYEYRVGYKTNWKNLYGTLFRNDSLMIYNSNYVPINNAVSKNTLLNGNDGWAQVVMTETTNGYMVGFIDSVSAIGAEYHDYDYGAQVYNNAIYAVESGNFGLVSYFTPGDVLLIERVGSNFYLRQNEVVIYTSSMSNTTDYKLKVSVFGLPVYNIGASFMDTANVHFPNYVQNNTVIRHSSCEFVNDGGIELIAPEVGYTFTWSPGTQNTSSITSKTEGSYSVTVQDTLGNSSVKNYNVLYKTSWENLDGMAFSNDTLTGVSSPVPGGFCSATSKNILKAHEDGEISWIMSDIPYEIIVGFFDTLSIYPGDFADITDGLYKTIYNQLYYTSGGYFTNIGYNFQGDVMKIRRENDTLRFYINNGLLLTTVPSNTNSDWRIKTAINSGGVYANIGCSFQSTLNAAIVREHVDLMVSPVSGSAAISPFGGTSPYEVTWKLDGVVSNARTGMTQGSYTVVISDSTNTDKIGKVVNIGAKLHWGSVTNATITADTLYAINGASLGIAVSDDLIYRNTDTWFEGQITSLTHDFAMGFVAVTNTLISPTLPGISDSTVISKIRLADTLMQNAISLTLPFHTADSVLNLASKYSEVHLMRLRNGQIRSLEKGSSYANYYNYQIGDIVKIGRDDSNRIYIAINDRVKIYEPTPNPDQFFFPVVYVNGPNGPGITGKGGKFIDPNTQVNIIVTQKYPVLRKKLDGGFYKISPANMLYFKYDAEYNNGSLNYVVYNDKNQLQTLSSLTKNYGDNRFSLNVASLATGYYYLEVINEKNESFKLKFKK